MSYLSGSQEYNRLDFEQEIAVLNHMQRTRNNIYHFLYAEKSLCYLSRFNGWRGHRIIGSFHHCSFRYAEYFSSMKHFRKLAHAVVVSRTQIPFMEGIIGKGNVSFVPYAVDTSVFHPNPNATKSAACRFVCSGFHLRDFETLYHVIKATSQERTELEFLVIGGDQDWKDRFLSLPNVEWKHGIPDAEYVQSLQSSDVMLLPLIDSTSVTAVLEAIACGLPIITTRGGVEDYVTPDCSFIHQPANVTEIVASALKLADDHALRRQMSEAALALSQQFNWESSSRKMRELYDRV